MGLIWGWGSFGVDGSLEVVVVDVHRELSIFDMMI
jgi:hypothetical protein